MHLNNLHFFSISLGSDGTVLLESTTVDFLSSPQSEDNPEGNDRRLEEEKHAFLIKAFKKWILIFLTQ